MARLTLVQPAFCLPFLPWSSGTDFKLLSAKYRRLANFIAICRDRDTGHVYRDATSGRPRIVYTPSDFDRAHNLRGVLELCRILFVRGAREIVPSVAGFAPFVRSADKDADKVKADFEKWLARLKAHGNKLPASPYGSAHQMGTCRMSAKPKEGVVDPKGKVWGTEGLYVADASVFPSASGVNPMVTTMAISDYIAQGLCEELRSEGVAARL
jgi:choline dehydrogenase-like flavoprotein